jgi:hypothetical protein
MRRVRHRERPGPNRVLDPPPCGAMEVVALAEDEMKAACQKIAANWRIGVNNPQKCDVVEV